MRELGGEHKMQKSKTINVDGVEYIRADEMTVSAVELDGKEYVICRADRTGVFAGYLESRNGQEVVLLNARRLWYWSGAASLSQLSVDGVANPSDCKFPCEVSTVTILDAIEILPVTQKAKDSIASVAVWKE